VLLWEWTAEGGSGEHCRQARGGAGCRKKGVRALIGGSNKQKKERGAAMMDAGSRGIDEGISKYKKNTGQQIL
jgi:hypothetical protein